MRCRKFKKADSKQVSELMIKAFKSFLGDKLENLDGFQMVYQQNKKMYSKKLMKE